MKHHNLQSIVLVRGIMPAFFLAAAALSHADTFWTGPSITFTHDAGSDTVDMVTTNHVGDDAVNNVWLTRGSSKPLYNAAAESGWNGSTSPANTLWAVASGDLTDAASLTYDTFDNVVGQPQNSPEQSVGQTFYVKIVSDNTYFSLTLVAWGASDGGSFTYTRSTPAVVLTPPTVSITNPLAGAVFAAPASLKLGADASVSGGMVTNVQFFANGISAGSVLAEPFNLTTGNLAAGAYSLTAVATAGGISTTSAVVNVSVVSPVTVSLSGANINTGQFKFNYSANAGLAYVLQSSTNLVNWVSLSTNVASGTSILFSATLSSSGTKFYRVGRLPNP